MSVAADGQFSAEEKYSSALDFKNKGNEEFKKKEFKRAVGYYHRALLFIRGIDQHAAEVPKLLASEDRVNLREERLRQLNDGLLDEVKQLKADCYNNLAACLLKEENVEPDRVLKYCNEALELSPTNSKTWFRRAQARFRLHHFEEAEEDLVKARELVSVSEAKPDAAIEKLLARCRQANKLHYEQNRSMYRNMFSNS